MPFYCLFLVRKIGRAWLVEKRRVVGEEARHCCAVLAQRHFEFDVVVSAPGLGGELIGVVGLVPPLRLANHGVR